MNYRLFQYALPAPPELEDLNAFLASHRVASVAQEWVQGPAGPMLVFLVQTLDGPRPATRASESRIDYRAVLDDDQFQLFSRLRDERKKIAHEEGIPVYAVFSNAQLAEIVKSKATTAEELRAIDGLGKARVERYGERMTKHVTEHA